MLRGPLPFATTRQFVPLYRAVAAVRNDLVRASVWGAVMSVSAALALALAVFVAYAVLWTLVRSPQQDFGWTLAEYSGAALGTFAGLVLAGLLIPGDSHSGAFGPIPTASTVDDLVPHGRAITLITGCLIYLTLSPIGGAMALLTRRRDVSTVLGFALLPATLMRAWLRGIADTVWLAGLSSRDVACAEAIYAETLDGSVPAAELNDVAEAFGARRFQRALKLLGLVRWVSVIPSRQHTYRVCAA